MKNKGLVLVGGIVAVIMLAAGIWLLATKPACPAPETPAEQPLKAEVEAPAPETVAAPAEDADKVVRKKKMPTNPMAIGGMLEGGEEMPAMPTDAEIEEGIDKMLSEYRNMPEEQKKQMLEFMKHMPDMMAMQKVRMKQQFDKLSTEDRAKAVKQFETMRPVMDKAFGMAHKKMTDAEKKELAPMINGVREMTDYVYQELTNPTPPAAESDGAADLFSPGDVTAE